MYSTRIHGTDYVIGHDLKDEKGNKSGIYVADAASANTAFDLDEDLRNAANNIPLYVTSDKAENQSITCPLDEGVDKAEITVDSMPTDEEIFRKIRNSKEEVYKSDPNNPDNKVIIPKENLTTDKYAIRWYVLKYQNSDGWHITRRITRTIPTAISSIRKKAFRSRWLRMPPTLINSTTKRYI